MEDSVRATAGDGRRPAGEPPWHGGFSIGLFFASALVLITYTLLPLPGQRAFGAGNYWLAGVLFVAQVVVSRYFQRRAVRGARGGG
ncbi:hypothetical protein [Pseudofrankia inefficax]|uniref:Uncharacterized protein n=1 Tax=Pseudofrankia inefficax (strain DSM 45817 / CECT 9037 / DDB 130130 / EuI1c) TaxID=298654 RepID=E3IXR2_PSEI1|nr:hypothetical protein [Pseudofrankia inefficax]ADP80221.1 hypothetical protein FraEuI1c_2182 [Pseudofrankia inefficax]